MGVLALRRGNAALCLRNRCLCVGQLTLRGSEFCLCRCQLFADSSRIDNDQRITGMHLISLGNQHLRDFALNSQAKFFRIARSRFTAALDISANIAIGNDCSRRNCVLRAGIARANDSQYRTADQQNNQSGCNDNADAFTLIKSFAKEFSKLLCLLVFFVSISFFGCFFRCSIFLRLNGLVRVVFWHRRKRLCLLKLLFILVFAEELLLVLAHILMFLSMLCSCETEPCLILEVIS